MKKLISSTLALTMLATPLISSTCFADETNNPNGHYVQNEDRSEPFKEKKCDSQKTRKTLAGVAAGTVAITGATVATLKLCKNQLPENLKAKLSSLFTKKTQENTESEKSSETVTETETAKDENTETIAAEPEVSKNQTIETVTADSNITKNETIEPITTEPSISMNKNIETVATESNITKNETTIETIAAELNITKKETTGSVAVNSNTTKNETADIEAIKAKIIQSLAKDNTTNNPNDANWLNTLKSTAENVWNSAKDSFSAIPTPIKYVGYAVLTVLLYLGGHRAMKGFNNLLTKRKETAAALVGASADAAANAAAPLVDAAANAAAAEAAIIAEEKTFMDTMGNVADFFIKEAADAAATVAVDAAANAESAVVVSPVGKESLKQLSLLNVDLTKLNMYVNGNNVDTVRFRIGNEVLPFTISREFLIETLQKLNTDGNNAALIPEKYREFFNIFSPAQIVKALNYLKTLKAV